MARLMQALNKRKEEIVAIFSAKNQYGFTLIEFLICSSIITFLIVGTAQMMSHSLLVKKRSECSIKSVELASAKLEYLKSLSYEDEKLNAGSVSEFVRTGDSENLFYREWRIQDVDADMKKIEIGCFHVNYPQKGTRLVLFLSGKLGF